jgi:hypothetical protein
MAAAFGYHPGGTRSRSCIHLQQDAYDTDSLIRVLEQLAGFYRGQRVVLLWDGLSAYWSSKMRAHVDPQRDWLTVERLAAYGITRLVGPGFQDHIAPRLAGPRPPYGAASWSNVTPPPTNQDLTQRQCA